LAVIAKRADCIIHFGWALGIQDENRTLTLRTAADQKKTIIKTAYLAVVAVWLRKLKEHQEVQEVDKQIGNLTAALHKGQRIGLK
jgi:hypothetical protein